MSTPNAAPLSLSCYAKVNLSLEILGKRSDGFHELRTLMHELDLADTLLVSEGSGDDQLEVEGMDLGPSQDNLLIKAVKLLRQQESGIPALNLKLIKNIPTGGGMGGGSSDAVVLLKHLMDHYCGHRRGLNEMAASLGSDTNFFIEGGSSWCYGRGEIVVPTKAQNKAFNLILPPFGCSTPTVFAHVQAKLLPEQWEVDLSQTEYELGRNDLEKPCTTAYPDMQRCLKTLRAAGVHAYLSGSGSTIFTCHDDSSCRDMEAQVLPRLLPEARILSANSRKL